MTTDIDVGAAGHPTTTAEWQGVFDAWFPNGANVTQVEDVPEGVSEDEDDSVHFLTPRIRVLSMIEDFPKLRIPSTISKEVEVLAKTIESGFGGVLITQPPGPYRPQFILTTNFGPGAAAMLKVCADLWEKDSDWAWDIQ